jgi:hypothetical protein
MQQQQVMLTYSAFILNWSKVEQAAAREMR